MVVPLLLVTSCAASDDEQASESATAAQSGSAESDANDVDAETDEQIVCNLFSNDEISAITGFEAVSAEGSTMGLPMCEWEMSIPAMVDFFALKGNQGFTIAPGFEMWHDEATATSALLDLTGKIFDRI